VRLRTGLECMEDFLLNARHRPPPGRRAPPPGPSGRGAPMLVGWSSAPCHRGDGGRPDHPQMKRRSLATTLQYIHLSGRDLQARLAQGMDQIHSWRLAELAEAFGAPAFPSRALRAACCRASEWRSRTTSRWLECR
jgi:hypothetical protein